MEPVPRDTDPQPDVDFLVQQDIAGKRSLIGYETSGRIATITLDSPATGNCVSSDLAEEFRDVCRKVREEDGIRVVVVTGNGPSFSAGRSSFPEDSRCIDAVDVESWLAWMRVAESLAALPMPVIAGLNGDALDHGLELALAADLRVCSDNARLGFPDRTPASGFPFDGGTQRLPRLVGPATALDMLLTGRTVSAAEALQMGLVNKVAAAAYVGEATRKVAEEIAEGAPVAARFAKEAVRDGQELVLQQGLRLEADLNVLLQTTEDRAEGLASFREKRNPAYRGR